MATIPVPNTGGLGFGDDGVWVVDRGAVNDADVDAATASIERIDPSTNEIVETVDGAIGAELVGTGGAVWVASPYFDSLLRVDRRTGDFEEIVTEQLTPGNIAAQTKTLDSADVYPYAIVVADDALWVANHHAGSLTRVDPATGDVEASIRIVEPGGSGPANLAANGDRVWVTSSRSFDVVEIDTATNEVVETNSVEPAGACGAMAADATSVWVTSGFDAPDEDPCKQPEHWGVSRIDRQTRDVTHIDVGGRPFGVALLGDAAWIVTDMPTPELVRIDTATYEVTGRMPLPLPPFIKTPIMAADGSLWIRVVPFASDAPPLPSGASGGDGAVLRVDPLD